MRALLLLLISLAAAPLAIAQTVVVHPNQYLTTEGVTNNSWPFNYTTGAGHYQQAYDSTQFTGPLTITEMSFRYKGDPTTPYPGATVNFKLTLCYCAVAWNGLSSTFASNLGPGQTVVFNGNWAIPPFAGDPALPNPFTARLTLTTPFSYDPAQGDLLMECEMYQAAGGSSGAFARASNSTGVYRVYANTGNPTEPMGTVDDVGLITEFTGSSQIIPYGTGCAGAGGFVPALDMSGTPSPGQQVTLTLGKGLGGALSALLVSVGSASVPLGGGCTLLVTSTPLALFIPLGGSGPGTGSYALPALIPTTTPTATAYLQAFVNDPAGPIGLSVSNGLKVEIK